MMSAPTVALTLDEALALQSERPDQLLSLLSQDHRALDAALLSLNFRRSQAWSAGERDLIRSLLARAYAHIGDVRFFNELLWYSPDREDALLRDAWSAFFAALDTDGCHPFGLATRAEAQALVDEQTRAPSPQGQPRTLNVGLLGMPWLFRGLVPALQERGHDVRVFSIPHHHNRARRLFLQSRILPWAFHRLGGAGFEYTSLPSDHTSDFVKQALTETRLDVGFHKLGFIIRPNIISAFRYGLLNDHWGVLPFIRGRSTLEYSVLFGFPICATVHFVDSGIDTGQVVSLTHYPELDGVRKVARVKKAVRDATFTRAKVALDRVAQSGFAPLDNPKVAGAQFFAMHPALQAYVESGAKDT